MLSDTYDCLCPLWSLIMVSLNAISKKCHHAPQPMSMSMSMSSVCCSCHCITRHH